MEVMRVQVDQDQVKEVGILEVKAALNLSLHDSRTVKLLK